MWSATCENQDCDQLGIPKGGLDPDPPELVVCGACQEPCTISDDAGAGDDAG
jgi:hypothetical protein